MLMTRLVFLCFHFCGGLRNPIQERTSHARGNIRRCYRQRRSTVLPVIRSKIHHPKISSRWHVIARVLLLGALLQAGDAPARVFCVATAEELQSALTDASDGGVAASENNIIDLVKATYQTGSATGGLPFHYVLHSAGTLILTAGFDSGCPPRTAFDPALTILDGGLATTVLSMQLGGSAVTLQYLTVQNGKATDAGGGLEILTPLTSNAHITVSQCIIRNNHSDTAGGGFYIGASTSLNTIGADFHDNLIYGNSTDGSGGAGLLEGNAGNTYIDLKLYHNTVVQNTTSLAGATGGLVDGFAGSSTMLNNILFGNSNYDLRLASGNTTLKYNDVGALDGMTPAATLANVSVDPDFIDSANGDFRLAGGSPLLAFSPYVNPDNINIDIFGEHYGHAGLVDLGPYEDTIFIDGAELPPPQ